MLAMLRAIPALIIPVGIYNLIALGGGTGATMIAERNPDGSLVLDAAGNEVGILVAPLMTTLQKPFFSMPMNWDVSWQMTNGDILIIV